MAHPLLVLPDDQVVGYLTAHLTELLEQETSPASLLETRLLSLPFAYRSRVRQIILGALRSSNEALTEHRLQLIDGRIVPPTVANWLNDFARYDEQLQWQTKSPSWSTLDDSDRQRVARLFDVARVLRRELEEKVVTPAQPSGISTARPEPFNPVITQVARAAGVTLTDALMSSRFATVVRSGIKGIRSSGQLAEIFSRQQDQGGLGFDQPTTQRLIQAIAPLAAQYAQGSLELGPQQPLKPPTLKPFVAPTIPAISWQQPAGPNLQPEPVSPTPLRVQPSAPVRFKARPSAPPPLVPVRRFSRPRRTVVHDIKQPSSKLVGPVEELHRLDLTSFRRLGSDPTSVVQKVKQKIDLLGEDSLTKKAEGIKAWKQSPTNQLYLAIGARSLSEGKPIEAVIKDRERLGDVVVSTAEFQAIADLNKALRF